MRQCFKNIPAEFQSRPTFLAGFFSKRVTDDDDRRKTFFLASCSEYSSLIYRVVTMEYRTGDRGDACISSRSALSLEPGPSRARHFPRDMLLLTTTARERAWHSASFLQLSFDQH